jgi:uncharacterized alpha-E superfamily protein
MSYNEGWHFGQVGLMLERADKTSRIIDMKYFILLPQGTEVGTPYDNLQWAALLKSASGYEMYRKKYSRIHYHDVTSFLILDREFPRAILTCLGKAQESLHTISGTPIQYFSNPAEREIGKLVGEMRYTNIEDIFDKGLHEYLDDTQDRINAIGNSIFETFIEVKPTEQLKASNNQ